MSGAMDWRVSVLPTATYGLQHYRSGRYWELPELLLSCQRSVGLKSLHRADDKLLDLPASEWRMA